MPREKSIGPTVNTTNARRFGNRNASAQSSSRRSRDKGLLVDRAPSARAIGDLARAYLASASSLLALVAMFSPTSLGVFEPSTSGAISAPSNGAYSTPTRE